VRFAESSTPRRLLTRLSPYSCLLRKRRPLLPFLPPAGTRLTFLPHCRTSTTASRTAGTLLMRSQRCSLRTTSKSRDCTRREVRLSSPSHLCLPTNDLFVLLLTFPSELLSLAYQLATSSSSPSPPSTVPLSPSPSPLPHKRSTPPSNTGTNDSQSMRCTWRRSMRE
jgi:hypothetical protein